MGAGAGDRGGVSVPDPSRWGLEEDYNESAGDPPPQVLYPILVAGTVFLYPAATKQQSIHVSQLEPEDEQEQDEQADQEQAEEDDHHSDYSLPDCKRRRHK